MFCLHRDYSERDRGTEVELLLPPLSEVTRAPRCCGTLRKLRTIDCLLGGDGTAVEPDVSLMT
jgi:hypothetical protein